MDVEATNICDFLETRENYLFLNDFSELIVVRKLGHEQTNIPLRGDGPKELKVALSLINSPGGPVLFGITQGSSSNRWRAPRGARSYQAA